MFCYLAVIIYLWGGVRQGKRVTPKVVYTKQKGSKNFFILDKVYHNAYIMLFNAM